MYPAMCTESGARLKQPFLFLQGTHDSARSSLFPFTYRSPKLLANQNGKSDSSYRLLKQIPLAACGVTPAPKARLPGKAACGISQNNFFLIVIVPPGSSESMLQTFTLLLDFLG